MAAPRPFTLAELADAALDVARMNAHAMNAMEFIAAHEAAGPNTRRALADVRRSTEAMVTIARILTELARMPQLAPEGAARQGDER